MDNFFFLIKQPDKSSEKLATFSWQSLIRKINMQNEFSILRFQFIHTHIGPIFYSPIYKFESTTSGFQSLKLILRIQGKRWWVYKSRCGTVANASSPIFRLKKGYFIFMKKMWISEGEKWLLRKNCQKKSWAAPTTNFWICHWCGMSMYIRK